MDGAAVDLGEWVTRVDLELSVPRERAQEQLDIGSSDVNDPSDSGDLSSSEDSLTPVAQELGDLRSHTDGTEATGMHNLDRLTEEVIRRCADAMSRMEPTRPDIVRATRAFQALKRFGAPLRGVEVKGGFFSLSKPASSMQFWSHSWHGSKWAKITTLFRMQRLLLGRICRALLLCHRFGHIWASFLFLAAARACVSGPALYQRRSWAEARGPLQHGRHTEELELHAGPLGHDLPNAPVVRLRGCSLLAQPPAEPEATLLGPVMAPASIALTLACGGAYLSISLTASTVLTSSQQFWWWPFWLIIGAIAGMIFLKIADVVRAYCREVENLSDQLRGFRFDDAVAHCCSVGHIDPSSGSPILCDREIVRRCIIKWFGSVGEFEATVRTEVLDILYSDLSAALVSYRRIVEASPVILWVFFDFSLLPMRASIDQGIWLLLRGVTYWLAVIPTLFVVMYTLAHLTRRERRSRCLDKLVSLLLVCVGIGFFMAVTTLEGVLLILLHAPWLPFSAYGAMFLLVNVGLTALAFHRLKAS